MCVGIYVSMYVSICVSICIKSNIIRLVEEALICIYISII